MQILTEVVCALVVQASFKGTTRVARVMALI